MKSSIIAALPGFLLGAVAMLVAARESSDVFFKNRVALLPFELAAESKRLVQSGDLMIAASNGAGCHSAARTAGSDPEAMRRAAQSALGT